MGDAESACFSFCLKQATYESIGIQPHGDPISCRQAQRPAEGWNNIWQERTCVSSCARRFERPTILLTPCDATVSSPPNLDAIDTREMGSESVP